MASKNRVSTLASDIEKIWNEKIMTRFDKGELCSERHLQAELYKHLPEKYTVWVEPTLDIMDFERNGSRPDLVITEGGFVVGIVEIKYSFSSSGIDIKDDIEKLKLLSEKNMSVPLKLNPQTGKWDGHFELIADEVLLFFAVIGRDGIEAVDYEIWKKPTIENSPKKNFYHLYGRVMEGSSHVFGCKPIPYNS